MKLNILYLTLKTDKPVLESPSKLRGYIGNTFKNNPILHNHSDYGFIYTYPKVQYKVINNTPVILGINEGAEALKDIFDKIDQLKLDKEYKIKEIQINQIKSDFGPKRENSQYNFITPWLAFNQDNYKRFKAIKNWKERKLLLNNILIGNILSMCKGLDFVVNKRLYIHSYIALQTINYKNTKFIGFTGEFKVNFKIPDYFGLGKSVSRGYGVIKHASHEK
ncbi:MAG: CRISPR-associated endonuclease Cas6 [Methanosarcinales archaeon]